MTETQRRNEILRRLSIEYAGATTALEYENAFQLLVAVMLSAQSTDARVNRITPDLFRRFPTPQTIARLQPRQLEPHIASCGLFRTKAKNIVAACRQIVERFGGRVPTTREELESLPGVGHKTASVVLSVAYQDDAIAVDRHVFRVANRLRLVKAKTVREAEFGLMRVMPRAQWSQAHHWLIHHGRRVCHARRPNCPACPVVELCPAARSFLRLYRREQKNDGLKAARMTIDLSARRRSRQPRP